MAWRGSICAGARQRMLGSATLTPEAAGQVRKGDESLVDRVTRKKKMRGNTPRKSRRLLRQCGSELATHARRTRSKTRTLLLRISFSSKSRGNTRKNSRTTHLSTQK